MATIDFREEIKRLDVAERILLAEEIWDSIAENQDAVAVSQAQKDELDQRIESYNRAPYEGSSWQEVKERIHNLSFYLYYIGGAIQSGGKGAHNKPFNPDE